MYYSVAVSRHAAMIMVLFHKFEYCCAMCATKLIRKPTINRIRKHDY
jgi:hypothetical protein